MVAHFRIIKFNTIILNILLFIMSDPRVQEVVNKVINKIVRITITDDREYLGILI